MDGKRVTEEEDDKERQTQQALRLSEETFFEEMGQIGISRSSFEETCRVLSVLRNHTKKLGFEKGRDWINGIHFRNLRVSMVPLSNVSMDKPGFVLTRKQKRTHRNAVRFDRPSFLSFRVLIIARDEWVIR